MKISSASKIPLPLSRTICLLAVLCPVLCGLETERCNEAPYGGFDGRLSVVPIGKVPIQGDHVVGFEVVGDKPVVAFPHRLLAVTPKGLVSWTSLDEVAHVAADDKARVLIQTNKGISSAGRGQSLEPVTALTNANHGEIFDSGNINVLSLVKGSSANPTFVSIRPNGTSGSSLELHDPVRAVSWGTQGLSLIAGYALMEWPTGSSKISLLGADTGFAQAQDTCLLGPDRIVVALPNLVAVVSKETTSIIVNMSARVRCAADTLYLLDLKTGIIARATGADKLGYKDANVKYARDIISTLPHGVTERNPNFLEAARLLGCKQARELVGNRLLTRPVPH
jgi:hypothetical protein